MRNLKFSEAINEAIEIAMDFDSNVICYGLGVTDPKGIFSTTTGLEKKFGNNRVFDMPTSENAMTGVAIGAALAGIKPIMTHQRLDFFLLAMDQLVNGAAKWNYMFGGKKSVPITIRLIIGRGWGQGPTHSQNLQAWFAHIPGIKVVMPSSPEDAKGLLLSSIFDPNPVIFLEHRWLHNIIGEVSDGDSRIEIGKARLIRTGVDITIISMSYLTIEAIRAADFLSVHGIDCEIIDLRSIKPLDYNIIFESVSKTGRVLALDSGFTTCSFASEVITQIVTEKFTFLKNAPVRLAMPDVPEPTSHALTKNFHITAKEIVEKILCTFNLKDIDLTELNRQELHDIPGDWFTGPF